MKILRIRTLEKGWCDKDEMLLHASFQLLVDFIERENPDRVCDWDADPDQQRAWKEISELYRWWIKIRPTRKEPLDDRRIKIPPEQWKEIPGTKRYKLIQPDEKKYAAYYRALKKHFKLLEEWDDEDQRNLHRLVDVRPFLWC
jgi:hypothetical protein